MLRALAISAAVWFTAIPALGQEQGDIPEPAQINPQGVETWYQQYIHADGWTLIAADSEALALGSPDGVAQMEDGRLMATIRHEYYRPRAVGGQTVRSLQQIRMFDCDRHLNRVVSMTVFEKSNLQGPAVTRENPGAEWTPPQPGSLYLAAMERVCSAPRQAPQPAPPHN